MADLTLIIPALNEADNLQELLPQVHATLAGLSIRYEIIVIDEQADEKTRQVTEQHHARLLRPATHGYGRALVAGFEAAAGRYLITMDADQSHPADFLRDLWAARETAEIVIASRYVPGGRAYMPVTRLVLSRVLNMAFSRGLDLSTRDMSSGYRLYRAKVVKHQVYSGHDFDILQEALIGATVRGYSIREIPFAYEPRRRGSSHARVIKFGMAYLRAFARLWQQRNAAASGDYEYRAYDSLVLPHRYWHRQRCRLIRALAAAQGPSLDVGCGSSRILARLAAGSVGLDLSRPKLRFAARASGRPVLQGSALALPVASASFPCVVCSQVIEHVPRGEVLDELDRVLQPGGRLILGTPDYARWQWRAIERIYKFVMPWAYGPAFITRYSYAELVDDFVRRRGYALEAAHYILNGELILALRKPGRPPPSVV